MKCCIALSIDWEGLGTDSCDLRALVNFQDRVERELKRPLAITHFVDPNYFFSGFGLAAKNFLKERDQGGFEIGLHLHPHHNFVRSVGISPKDALRFSDTCVLSEPLLGRGHESLLTNYRADELLAMVKGGKDVLSAELSQPVHSFRAGGWTVDPVVLGFLERFGFLNDSSMTDFMSLNHSCWERSNLQRYIEMIWGSGQKVWGEIDSPFFAVDIFPDEFCPESKFVEVPNSLASVEYWSADRLWPATVFEERASEEGCNKYITLTAHQEGFARQSSKMHLALVDLHESATRLGYELEFKTVSEIGDSFLSSQIGKSIVEIDDKELLQLNVRDQSGLAPSNDFIAEAEPA